MITGEILEKIIFDLELGDKPVRCGIISCNSIRNYQLWLAYRELVPKDLEMDMEREVKQEARLKVMKSFRIKTKQSFYDAIKSMEKDA